MQFDIPQHIVQAISWTVLHSIWQISLIALVTWLILQRIPQYRPNLRYHTSLSALALSMMVVLVTFAVYLELPSKASGSGGPFVFSLESVFSSGIDRDHPGWIAFFNKHSATISQLWMAGALVFLLRYLIGLGYLQYLAYRPGLKQSPVLEKYLKRLKDRIGIEKNIVIATSNKVKTPMVTGFFRPLILFPVATITRLTPEEIETVIAHELAHIIRNDWVVNLFQSLIEVVLYYHPAIWWISTLVREERENCCDDIALTASSDNLSYARILVKLEELQSYSTPGMAMTLLTPRNQLLNRIKRLLGQPQNRNFMREKIIALALILCVAAVFAGNKINNEWIDLPALTMNKPLQLQMDSRQIALPGLSTITTTDTIPSGKQKSTSTSRFMINQDGENKSIQIQYENGEIVSLKVDGEEIEPDDYDDYITEMEEGWGNQWMENFNFEMDSFPFQKFQFGQNEGFFMDTEKLREMIPEMDGEMFRGFGQGLFFDEDGNSVFKFHGMHPDSNFAFKFDFEGDEFIALEEMMEKLKEGFMGDREHLHLFEKERMEELQHRMQELQQRMGERQDRELNRKEREQLREEMRQLREQEFNLQEMEELRQQMDDLRFHEMPGPDALWFRKGSASDQLANSLNRDGLLKIGENNKVELSGKELKINGDKQPANIHDKYKRIFEEATGMTLTKDSKMVFDIIGEKVNKSYRRI